jgi:putative endonuclease
VEQPERTGLGARGEDEAAEHYRQRGYRVLERNWSCRLGEIDLILTKGETLVFCEVKTRRGSSLGGPYEAVTWKKQRTLRRLAEAFLVASGARPADIRFDVASVTVPAFGMPSLHVYENAF